MLATTPLFYAYDWPRRVLSRVTVITGGGTKPANNATPQSHIAAGPDDDDTNVDKSDDTLDGGDEISQDTETTNMANKVKSAGHLHSTL